MSLTRHCLKAHWLRPDRHVHLLAGKASRERRRVDGWQLERPKQLWALFQYLAYLRDFFSFNILPTRLCHSLSNYCLPAWFFFFQNTAYLRDFFLFEHTACPFVSFSFKILPTCVIFSFKKKYCLPQRLFLFKNTAYLRDFSGHAVAILIFTIRAYRRFHQCAEEATARPKVISDNHPSSGVLSASKAMAAEKKNSLFRQLSSFSSFYWIDNNSLSLFFWRERRLTARCRFRRTRSDTAQWHGGLYTSIHGAGSRSCCLVTGKFQAVA